MSSFVGAEVAKSIIDLHKKIISTPKAKPKALEVIMIKPIIDRQLRTKIHQAIRRIFSSLLESSTNAKGAIVVSAMPKSRRNGNESVRETGHLKGKLGWQQLGGEYLHFTLYKENKDTMEAVSILSRQLKLSAKNFQFAGTKDRRGVTVQRISLYRVDAHRLVLDDADDECRRAARDHDVAQLAQRRGFAV